MFAVNVSANHSNVQGRHLYQTWHLFLYAYQPPVVARDGGEGTSQEAAKSPATWMSLRTPRDISSFFLKEPWTFRAVSKQRFF